MHSTSSPVGRRDGRLVRVALALGLSLWVQACGGGGGGGGGPPPPPVDHARLDACVLVGANVSDGCTTTTSNDPVLQLGDMAMGETKSRVLALYNGGDGDVSTTVSSVALAPTADAHYTVTLFRMQGGAETPASLPFELKPNHATELRVRVQFEAYVAVGAVSGMRVDVGATHPATTKPVPIQANVTGCPPGLGDCDGDPSNACETDLQTSLDHCGGCGTACSSAHGTPSCNAGVCGIACDAGFGNCDGGVANGCETDLSTTPANCGTCGNACDGTNGTPTCTASTCGITCNAGFADCDGNPANGCEVNVQTDVGHCGACATTCSSTNGTASCSGGTCGITCDAGFADCDGNAANGCEANLGSDLQHCGGCNTACSTNHGTATCTAGVCGITCAPGFADCDGNPANGCEVDLNADPSHCGACTTTCNGTNGTATCSAGVCGITCSAGFGNCDGNAANGCEVNLRTDPVHCGTCSSACNSTNGTATCSAGACGITCNAGYGNCDGNAANGCEVNLNTSTAHCGACATTCNATNGTASCTAGVCGIACNSGYGDCDGSAANGCEVNLNTDTVHCGACIVACNTTNGSASCTAGVCGISCSSGYGDCDGNAANGCEVNLSTDTLHCGACITACSTNHGTASCAAGACGISCNTGFANCDGNVANGCEVNLDNDPANCSACGNVCNATNGTPSCSSGACGISCNTGYGNCDANAANGCEVNLNTDPVHCGVCTNACTPANASPACAGGSCGVASCNAGFADCDASPANGCEVSLQSDPNNCGGCGVRCNSTNGTATCSAGSCGIVCAAGYADCDGDPSNGCEVNLNADPLHCGSCGGTCSSTNGTATCSAGVCGITCNAGFGNCDGSAANGCEVNLNTDPTHCGACVTACSATNGTATCAAGACGITCSAGFANCDGNAANGCEVNLNADPTHCGSCLNVCSANNGTPICAGGACGITCAPGFADCDGLVGNGCEVNLQADPANCSACGAACTAANGTPSCSGGTCGIAACDPGYSDCDGNAGDGCEVNLTADPTNCGVCGAACNLPNATPACTGGSCTVQGCNWGWSDCDADPSNGCEVNTAWDPSNCAACGNVCPVTQNVSAPACNVGACVVGACVAGWSDFDGNYADGCECKLPVVSQTCAAPLSLGTIHTGQSIQGPVDGLPSGAAYYAISFPMEGAAGGGTPRITFARNDGNRAVLDILPDCTGATYTCASEGGSAAIGVTDYTYTDNQSIGNYVRSAAWPVTVIVRVRAASGGTCPTYQLAVSR